MEITIFDRVTIKDKAFIARQLATMLSSGLTLDKALGILKSQMQKPFLKKTLEDVAKSLGENFFRGLKKTSQGI